MIKSRIYAGIPISNMMPVGKLRTMSRIYLYSSMKRSLMFLPVTAGVFGSPALAMAQAAVSSPAELCNTIRNIISIGASVLLALAGLIFLISAYYFLFGGASEDAQSKAKTYLIYGITGVVVALLAFSIPALIQAVINVPLFKAC